jgi:hypothetical protein
MKFASPRLLSAALVVLLATFLHGQVSPTAPSAVNTRAALKGNVADTCPHLFTAGNSTSNAFIQYCVTDNGNISLIQTPFGHFHLGAQGEGYGFCQQDPPATGYFDYLVGDSGNWQPAQIVSVSGSATKISRSTIDGNWTLVQTLSKVVATGSINIVMALTNNQAADKVAYLVRFADVDPDGAQSSALLGGGSLQSAFAWNDNPNFPFHYGLQLQNTGKWSGYQQGFVQKVPSGPNPCAFAFNANTSGAVENADLSLVYAYVDTVKGHKTATVTLSYRGR